MHPSKPNIALLIDADNAPAHEIESILTEITKHGVANIRKAYGNWTKPALKPWEDCLHEYAILPVQQFDYTKGKNATDAALIIDAMDLLYTHKLDAFAIVSSDCDFTPLVMRILANGLKAYGFGGRKTPLPFVHACSTFLYLEDSKKSKKTTSTATSKAGKTAEKTAQKKTGKELKQDTVLMNSLRKAVAETQNGQKWSGLSQVGSYLRQKSSFAPQSYGYARFISLFEATGSFEICRKPSGVYIRCKK
ncbi:NYN domain-containing protein [cf. Phormidesmis sp. LEGE 11477]|uniref:NYN domain-containing protein n=1 Tax=cf. Phormidesmis sp. LEGE 11477 TaxID=1828680 RepID=UPI0018827286|nr:NYN domain-containing protein [cf. Phormidesmis sp. LEGE 11477]MBE9061673.1 NYN domain-containing protein [cf. Phormidesmis sp. LEGE 11477]